MYMRKQNFCMLCLVETGFLFLLFLPLTKFVFDKEKGIELRWYPGPF